MIDYMPLKETLKRKRITTTALAGKLGMKRQQLSAYIDLKVYPKLSLIGKICDVLECDIKDVIRNCDTGSLAEAYAKKEAPNITDIEKGLKDAYIQGYNDAKN